MGEWRVEPATLRSPDSSTYSAMAAHYRTSMHKARGPDNSNPRVLKVCTEHSNVAFHRIFNFFPSLSMGPLWPPALSWCARDTPVLSVTAIQFWHHISRRSLRFWFCSSWWLTPWTLAVCILGKHWCVWCHYRTAPQKLYTPDFA